MSDTQQPAIVPGSEDEALILDSIGKWLTKEVKPYVREMDNAAEYPTQMVEQMKELGLFGATISPEYGGLGLSAVTYARIIEKITEVWMSLSGIFNSHLIMAAITERYGTEEQKQHFLPRFASGELRGGLALTEPDCGTDLQAELVHVHPAEHDRTRGLQFRGDRRVVGRNIVRKNLAGSRQRLALHRDDVLQPDRNSVERTACLPGRAALVRHLGLRERVRLVERIERPHAILRRADPAEMRASQFDRRQAARGKRVGHGGD
jgi:hypothetical protein